MFVENGWLDCADFGVVSKADPVRLWGLVMIENGGKLTVILEEFWQIRFCYEKKIKYDQNLGLLSLILVPLWESNKDGSSIESRGKGLEGLKIDDKKTRQLKLKAHFHYG